MPKPLEIKSSRDSLINKSIHTSDGVHIGNIHDIEDEGLVVVKGDMITTV
jgi:sporulation protein YlmC with PRC-barrel domain